MSPTTVSPPNPNAPNQELTAAALAGAPPSALPPGLPSLAGMSQEQLMTLLKTIPGVFNKVEGNKEDAAQALQTLSSTSTFSVTPGPSLQPTQPPGGPSGTPSFGEPGPSSHPHGPPSLSGGVPPTSHDEMSPDPTGVDGSPPSNSGGGRRSRGGAQIGTDEWTRQRKDNHKEVERRRRGNINEGINELGRIVPSGSGEKAKGAILSRAVQYIHHLKENEARNIEKWTLEKLLMDQAMGDMQAQLEEVRRMWEQEREGRQKVETELATLKGQQGSQQQKKGEKRPGDDANASAGDDAKRQKTD